MPIGACLAKDKASTLLTPGTHGSTFGGNPLVCSAALSVLDVIEKDNILDNVVQMSAYFADAFSNNLKDSDKVIDIRIKGLMIAIELNQDCSMLLQQALENKLLINITGQSIRLLPPLIINKDEADIIISTICNLIEAL